LEFKEIDREFTLLDEYMDMYIQILPECVSCGGLKIHKPQLPTFKYFKETYNDARYSLVMPNFKESKTIYDKIKIGAVHTRGLGSIDGIAYRYYNYWMGCKFFTGGNIQGNYTLNYEYLNKMLKHMK
jgi:hypothetical protein